MLSWIRIGVRLGLRSCVPLAIGYVVLLVLAGISMLPCLVPSIFVVPALAGGFILAYVRAARGEPFSFSALFEGFSQGRYWPIMGACCMLGAIAYGVSLPTQALLYVGLGAGLLAIAEWGTLGLFVLAILIPLAFAPAIYGISRVIWVMPLVVDRRLRVMEAFAASWHLTGRILNGFGMFVLLILLAIIALIPVTVVGGGTIAVLAGASAAYEQEYARQAVRVPAASSRMQPVGQTDVESAKGTSRKGNERSLNTQASLANQLVPVAFFGTLAVTAVCAVLSVLLWVTLCMPVFVGYRDMAPLVPPSLAYPAIA